MENSIIFNLEDTRSEKIAEALSNKTCKKILGLLAERDLNASEISEKLHVPLNTIGYNLAKLVDSGLIEKKKDFFWSIKGKKVEIYKLANKKIIISPKKLRLAILPAAVISGIAAFALKIFNDIQNKVSTTENVLDKALMLEKNIVEVRDTYSLSNTVGSVNESVSSLFTGFGDAWLWFLLGALFSLVVFLIWNWRKI